MRGRSGSYGHLESLDEGTEKAVQLVLQIVSDTAAAGMVVAYPRTACTLATRLPIFTRVLTASGHWFSNSSYYV